MKKFLKITAAILVLLLIFFVATFKYRQYKANQISIPENATSIVKIGIDEIYKSLASNMFLNPGFYFRSNHKKRSIVGESGFNHGIKIPASLYLYTVKDQPETALFSRLEISEYNSFQNFITHKLGFILSKQNGLYFATSRLGNVRICYNQNTAAIVISTKINDFDVALKEILTEKKFTKIGESKLKGIKTSTNHLVYLNHENQFSVDFKNGRVDFNGDFTSQLVIPPDKRQHRKFDRKSTASIWLNADFSKLTQKTYRFKNIVLEHDSLLKYYQGYLDLEWTNTTSQTDSIITYEYNDDFEKTERVTLKKRQVPNLLFNIKTKTAGLKSYLEHQQIVNRDSSILNKTIFPLYKVFVKSSERQLLLTTDSKNGIDNLQIPATEFFGLNVDFTKINAQMNVPKITESLKVFKLMEIRGKTGDTNKIRLTGTIKLMNEEVNSLYQILMNF